MKVIGVTSCPSGVAHTYMSAEALRTAATKYNIKVKVETQGLSGIENRLTQDDIDEADFVVLTTDTSIIGINRFKGKKAIKIEARDLIDYADDLIEKLLDSYY
ncbi:PTS fructose transporter subunit IIB [Ligilactobacillus agilis]|uniref:PTS fructose transporter subunit IIB n=1 Tax=Ligilactobacillus agilis TaxID=1601 RepID=UPI0034E20045